MYDKNTLAKRIKELRQKKDLTQRQLAKMANTTPTSVSAYEKGQKTPSIEVLCNIANALETSVDWLCGNTESKGNYTTLDAIRILAQLDGHFGDILNFATQYLQMSQLLSDDRITQGIFDSWLAGVTHSEG